MRIVIIGGVAGGASCAARARRLNEQAEILLIERGPFVSFANCGLPYYVGDVIHEESNLLVASPELFRQRFNIEVRTGHEAKAILSAERTIEVRELSSGRSYQVEYDALVLAPGASPLRPPLPGLDREGVFALRTMPDARAIRNFITSRQAKRAVVVGGGFIGLEVAENLVHRGLEVSLVEMLPQVMPPFDPEMASLIAERMRSKGVRLLLGQALASVEADLTVRTREGLELPTDLVIVALGVRPETALARSAGLELGERGGIRVNDQMRTSDPHIWAVGDAVEVQDVVTGRWGLLALAGPAQRQGRVAAASICGREARFRGVQGTAIVGLFGLAAGCTGASERTLRQVGRDDFSVVALHPGHHAGYYPGARPISIKLIFRTEDGLILGAQAVGDEAVDKRIDVIAMAIQKKATVFDLEECELCYAPQFGSAKDPVNMAGMIAANVVRGDLSLARWEEVSEQAGLVLDVREPSEFERGHIPGALNLPLGQLRSRLAELPTDRKLLVYCQVGQRAYYATRLLLQHGFSPALLSGGYHTWLDRTAADEASLVVK
ncbi:MAG: hypothetical protein AMXMBFR33_53000 [Candidatus Xenobia bacterium]